MENQIDPKAMTEEELEAKLFGTPSEDETKEAEATKETDEQKEAPTEEDELVTQKPESATDEHQEPKRETVEDWEKRYKNLRNSRDNKLHEAKRQLAASLETIQVLQQQNEELRNELATARAKADPLDEIFSPEETEVLGDDTTNIIKKATKKATEVATADLREQLKEERALRKKQEEARLANAKQDEYNIFLQRLGNIVPDYAQIDADPLFKDFCHKNYDIDGTLIADNFRTAEGRRDATTIARYMLQFKEMGKKPKEENPLAQKETPAGNRSDGSLSQQKQKEPKVFTRAEINKFYDDLARGLYVGKQKEADELEGQIEQAMMEGRVR